MISEWFDCNIDVKMTHKMSKNPLEVKDSNILVNLDSGDSDYILYMLFYQSSAIGCTTF